MSVSPVRIALVGYGYWGPNLVRNLVELPSADLVAICDGQDDALTRARRRYPGILTTSRFEDLIEDEAIDAVAIATPISTHFEMASRALEAGKHAFVEKPLAASSDEGVRLAEIARSAGLVLMPGHTFLYSPPVNMIRELIEADVLGDIYWISTSRVNLGLHQPDASVAWDLGPHDFSILRYWMDETPAYVSALSRGCIFSDTADVAFINLEFDSGAIAHVELSWLAPSKLRRTTLIGAKKMVVYDDTSAEPVRIFDSGVMLRDPQSYGEFQLSYRTGDIVSPHVQPAEPLQLEMLDFCEAIQNGTTPRSCAELGIEVVRMVEGVDASLAAGGGRVALNSADLSLA